MFVQTHAADCNHNRNRTGIFLAAPESLTIYRPKQSHRDSGKGQFQQQQQQRYHASHSAHDPVERFMREKTLLEQLRVRDARRGFVGSRGLENHRLKRMQSCLEGLRLHRESTVASSTIDSPRGQLRTAAARLATAAETASAADSRSRRVRRSPLPLTSASLPMTMPPLFPQQQHHNQQQQQQQQRSFHQPPTVNLGVDIQQPTSLPNLGRRNRQQGAGLQANSTMYFSVGVGGVGGQGLYRMPSGRERLRQLSRRGASNGGDVGSIHQQPHINDIFRLPEADAAQKGHAKMREQQQGLSRYRQSANPTQGATPLPPCPTPPTAAAAAAAAQQAMNSSEGAQDQDGNEDSFEPAPPPTAAQLRRRSGRRSQEDCEATPPPRPTPPSTAVRSVAGAGGRRLSSIEMTVQNEDGEAEEVEIDVADTEDDVVAPLAKDNQRCRRQPIADRISRRRNSEVAADIIRMSAAHRRREFAALIDEHQAIVRELEGGQKPQQQQQQQQQRPDKENIGRPNR